jgi:hypothetical protein
MFRPTTAFLRENVDTKKTFTVYDIKCRFRYEQIKLKLHYENHYSINICAITWNKQIILYSKAVTCTLQLKQLENPK